MNFYNDHEPFVGRWLNRLVVAGKIPHGHVDTRSIQEIQPDEITQYTQCHFFAGIAGWSRALQLAGWDSTRPVWSASLPCQPFSGAGSHRGASDDRNLWEDFYRLVRECRPPVIFGEQVADAIRFGWLDRVFDDLEKEAYSCGASILPACCVNAPHKRNRLWWVAYSSGVRCDQPRETKGDEIKEGREQRPNEAWELERRPEGHGRTRSIPHSQGIGCPEREQQRGNDSQTHTRRESHHCGAGDMVDSMRHRRGGRSEEIYARQDVETETARLRNVGNSDISGLETSGVQYGEQTKRKCTPWDGHYDDTIWIDFSDGKKRRIKSGLEPLAHGVPGRVGLLRAYGNSIVPQVAALFIKAFMGVENDAS